MTTSQRQMQHHRLIRLATYASVATALILVVFKGIAYQATDSVSILSSLVDSALDALASLLNLVAVRHALTPADREHRFGHGKAEPLAALGQAAFIGGSGVYLMHEVWLRLHEPQQIHETSTGILVMGVSIIATLGLVSFQRHVARKTGSIAITADASHYWGDFLSNGLAILALILAPLGFPLADPILGGLIAIYIIINAASIARDSYDILMDRELPDEDRDHIKAIALRHPAVHALHELRTRTSGQTMFIQLHIELDGHISLFEAHEISDAVEAELRKAYPNAEIIIHQDPLGAAEARKSFQ